MKTEFIKEKAKKHIEKPLNTNKAFDKIAFIEQIKNYKDEEINNSNQNLVNSTNLYEKLSKFKQTQNEIQNLKNITKFQIEHDIKQLYKLNIRNVLTECPYNIYTNNKTRTKNIDKYNKILEIIDIYNNKVKQNNNNSLHSINIVKDVPKKLENINDIYFDDILNTLMDIINLEFSSEKNLTNAINSLFNEKIEKQEKEKKKLIKFRDKEKTNEKFTFSKYFHSQNLLNLEKSSKKNKIIKILK